MELYEAMRDTPSWRYFRNDRLPDDVLQRFRDIARFAFSGGDGYADEHDVEWSFRPAPLMVVGQHTNESRKIAIAHSLRARVDG